MTTQHLPRRVCSFLLLLGVVLTFLRLCHVLPVPWLIALSPFLILAALAAGLLIFVLAGAALVEWRSARRRHQNRKRSQYQL